MKEEKVERLERNRKTARVRRMKKKQEAESLTNVLRRLEDENVRLFFELKKFRYPGENEGEGELEKLCTKLVQEEVQKQTPLYGCLFCNAILEGKNNHKQHLELEHPIDSKNPETKGLVTNEETLAYLNNLEEEMIKTNQNFKKLSRKVALSLTEEEKRKRRQEKNAENARICRQRKKVYTQKLRMKIPIEKMKQQALLALLPETVCSKLTLQTSATNVSVSSSSSEEDVDLPKCCGWKLKSKRNFSSNNLHDLSALHKHKHGREEKQPEPMPEPLSLHQINLMNALMNAMNANLMPNQTSINLLKANEKLANLNLSSLQPIIQPLVIPNQTLPNATGLGFNPESSSSTVEAARLLAKLQNCGH